METQQNNYYRVFKPALSMANYHLRIFY